MQSMRIGGVFARGGSRFLRWGLVTSMPMEVTTGMMKPIASLSLDLDNKWSYLKTHGEAGWKTFPSYLDVVIPRVLKLLDELHLKITFFVVGQDAALPRHAPVLRSLADAGHEI